MVTFIKDSLKVIILSAVVSLSIFLVLAQGGWVEPTVAPPGGNVAAPLNTGSTGQSKSGGLILNTGGAINGLIVQSGNVGIGTTSPGTLLSLASGSSFINFTPNSTSTLSNGINVTAGCLAIKGVCIGGGEWKIVGYANGTYAAPLIISGLEADAKYEVIIDVYVSQGLSLWMRLNEDLSNNYSYYRRAVCSNGPGDRSSVSETEFQIIHTSNNAAEALSADLFIKRNPIGSPNRGIVVMGDTGSVNDDPHVCQGGFFGFLDTDAGLSSISFRTSTGFGNIVGEITILKLIVP